MVLGLTGGIASGKSVVSTIFETMGYSVYNTDRRAKELMVSSQTIIDKLTALLGADAYIQGALNKALIASFLFENSEQKQLIDNIVHPVVRDDFNRWVAMHKDEQLLVMECAILIEANFIEHVDKSALVYAPMELRLERAISRDKSTEELIKSRMNAQMAEENKRLMVDYIIENRADSLLLPQVYQLIEELTSLK